MTLTCPNCGNEIPIPKRMVKSVKCSFCKDQFGVEYTDENGNPPKYFWDKHPTATKVLSIAIPIISEAALWIIDHWDEFFPREISEVSANSLSSIAAHPDTTIAVEAPAPETMLLAPDSPEANEKLAHYGLKTRKLPLGYSASPAKKKEAHDLGIDIGTTHTIVDPYDKPYKVKST